MIRAALSLALLVPGVAIAHPASSPYVPCKPGKGTPIFEARWHHGHVKVITKVFKSGEWQRTKSGYGDSSRKGCIEPPRLDEIRAALKAAKWKKMIAQEPCMGVDSSTTDLYTNGSKRYVDETCSKYSLDSTSEKAVALVEAQIPDGFATGIPDDDVLPY